MVEPRMTRSRTRCGARLDTSMHQHVHGEDDRGEGSSTGQTRCDRDPCCRPGRRDRCSSISSMPIPPDSLPPPRKRRSQFRLGRAEEQQQQQQQGDSVAFMSPNAAHLANGSNGPSLMSAVPLRVHQMPDHVNSPHSRLRRRSPSCHRIPPTIPNDPPSMSVPLIGMQEGTTPSLPLPPPPSLSPVKPRCLVGGGKRRGTRRQGGKPNGCAEPRPARGARSTRSRRTSATPTTLESIAAEAIAIKTEVTRLGLVLRDITADGNCLFRAIADQLWGDQKRHVEVRKLVCDHLERERDAFADFVAGFLTAGEDYDGYVRRLRGQGVYGSHIELQAAAAVFRRKIRIILSQTSYTVEWSGSDETPGPTVEDSVKEQPHNGTPRRRTRASTNVVRSGPPPEPVVSSSAPDTSKPTEEYDSALADYIPPVKPGYSMIWLALFADAEHYESVRPKGNRSGPAEVPDSAATPHARDVSEAARRERGEKIVGDSVAKSDTAASRDSRLQQVFASLPPDHELTDIHVAGVLARTKGDVSAAVEILLEEIDLNAESASTDEDDASIGEEAVEELLSSSPENAPDAHGRAPHSTSNSNPTSISTSKRVSAASSYRERAASPSSSEHDDAHSTSTAPTSPLSHVTGDTGDDTGSEYKDSDAEDDAAPAAHRPHTALRGHARRGRRGAVTRGHPKRTSKM